MERTAYRLIAATSFAAAAAMGASAAVTLAEESADADVRPVVVTEPAVATQLLPGSATAGLIPRTVAPQRPQGEVAVPADDAPEAAPAPGALPAERAHGGARLLAAAGTSTDPVATGGSTVSFSVEVEASTGLDPDTVAALVEEALYDARSWASDYELRRTTPADAWIHVVVAEPWTVDSFCGEAGLNTGGWLSCWTGDTAAINVARWTQGVAHYDDLAQYRRYVVNHEVGHGLGHGHRDCPGDGSLAPLMQQQTKSLDGCVANEWAHP